MRVPPALAADTNYRLERRRATADDSAADSARRRDCERAAYARAEDRPVMAPTRRFRRRPRALPHPSRHRARRPRSSYRAERRKLRRRARYGRETPRLGREPLPCVIEQPLNVTDSRDIRESGANVLAVRDSLREPADDRSCLVQLPFVGLWGAIDLLKIALHGVDAALQFVGAVGRSGNDVAEDERVVQRRPADHHAIDSRLLEH